VKHARQAAGCNRCLRRTACHSCTKERPFAIVHSTTHGMHTTHDGLLCSLVHTLAKCNAQNDDWCPYITSRGPQQRPATTQCTCLGCFSGARTCTAGIGNAAGLDSHACCTAFNSRGTLIYMPIKFTLAHQPPWPVRKVLLYCRASYLTLTREAPHERRRAGVTSNTTTLKQQPSKVPPAFATYR
jgi:hypothetical protein